MTDSFHLYLNGRQAWLRRRTGWPWRQTVSALGQWDWDAAAPATLTLAPALAKGGRLHVYFGSALCRFGAVVLPAGLGDDAEQLAVAGAHMQVQLGLAPADWTLTLDAAAGPDGKANICAVRRTLLARLETLAREHDLRLVSATPFVTGVWNAFDQRRPAQLQGDHALVAVEDDAFTLITARAGALASLSSLSHGCEPELLGRELKRLALSMGGNGEPIRLALSSAVAPMGQAYGSKVLKRADFCAPALQADFRDLLFAEA